MTTSLHQQVARNWDSWPSALKAAGLVVAVSGGADSVALLDALSGFARRDGVRLTVAHANHGLRGRDSDADAASVGELAARLGWPCVITRLDIRGEKERTQESLEMTARRLRHAFLARTARETGARAVALAHHGDDQVELFLLRLFRGAGGDGLGGMAERSASPADPGITLLRPLLTVTRAEILDYLRQQQLEFREDASNQDESIPRNHLRHTILPWLRREVGEHLDRVIRRTSEIVRADADCVDEWAVKWMSARRHERFAALPVAVQRAVIRRQLWDLNCPVDFELVERLRLTQSNQSVTAQTTLKRTPSGRLEPMAPAAPFNPDRTTVTLKPSGRTQFDGLHLRWHRSSRSHFKPSKPNAASREQFDATRVGDVIQLRHWQAGDRFQPLGMPQATKLQNLFTNRKVPAAERRQRVVATTADGTLFWVEGLPLGEAFKIQPSTQSRLNWTWQRPQVPQESA